MSGTTHPHTDLGNAERLVELHGEDLRHVGAWGRWLSFDGKRWREDEDGGAMRCAIKTSQALVAEAKARIDVACTAHAAGESEATVKVMKEANGRFRHAVQAQSHKRLVAMLAIARSDTRVAVSHEQLDADPMLLNVENGTIDLRTGELCAHRRMDLITKLAPVVYERTAACPMWEAFIARAMHDSADLVDYLARVVGYTLTGRTVEHVLGFFFGAGANGKTTFFRTLHAMLGDYAAPAPRGLLFRARGGERHPTELAALHGRRFVSCSEIESGQSFDEALVKDLTGGDLVMARRMREDFWHFQPTHKLFLAGNHKPSVRGDDEGIWRRLRLIPWTVVVPAAERDALLLDKLRAELPGILTWAVRGCLKWQRDGLGDPPDVVNATAEYRDESDTLGAFFESCLTFEREGRITCRRLRDVYEAWASDHGYENLVGPRKLAERLKTCGVKKTTVRTPTKDSLGFQRAGGPRDGWAGVREASDAERVARSDLKWADRGSSDRTDVREATNGESHTTDHYTATTEFERAAERHGVYRGS